MISIPPDLLQGKRILLGVTGSISAYKSLELVRLFVKAGATVKVVMSDSAKRFVTPLSFEALSGNSVLDNESESWTSSHNHIGVVEESDVLVIAPATANTIALLANGIANNLLLQCALADVKRKVLAPAANTNMLSNPITKGSLKMLKVAGYEIVQTQVKELVCKNIGDGALADPLQIFYATARVLLRDEFWSYRRAIVTGGGSIERIDDVRFIGNFSSGKMALSLATALYLRGADVLYIGTKDSDLLPKPIKRLRVESSDEMQRYLNDAVEFANRAMKTEPTLMDDSAIRSITKEPYLFMTAAISDYSVANPQSGKLKKELLGESWQLELKKRGDIIASVDKSRIKTVAFKAELDEKVALANAKKAFKSKGVDFMALNTISENNPFGSEESAITLISKHNTKELHRALKLELSLSLIDEVH